MTIRKSHVRKRVAEAAMLLFLITVDPLQRAISQLEDRARPAIVLIVRQGSTHNRALLRRFGLSIPIHSIFELHGSLRG